jgi:hypothetical protein
MCHVRALENHGLRGKFVQVRRMYLCASVTCERVRSLLVRQEKNQIGLLLCSHVFGSRTKSALTNFCNHLALAHRFRRDGWMARDQFERALEQFFSWRNLVPGRRA